MLRDRLSAPRSDVVHLRLLAGIFRIVLRGDAPQLRPFYPVLGGAADPAEAWPHVETVLRRHADELRASLDIAPQTNEPGRAARHDRLAAALDVLRRHPVTIDRAGASEWLATQLATPRPDVLTVVWQSITEQYWPATESTSVRDIVAHARDRMPLAHVSLEGVPPPIGPAGYDVVAHGAELRVDGRLIGHSTHHGPPIVLPG